MINIKTIKFHNNASSAETSQVATNTHQGELLVLEVSATTISMTVQGIVDATEGNTEWHDLAVINAKTLTAEESITEPGIYYVSVDGVAKIRTVIESMTGTANVFGVIRG